ncbi:Uncharacterized membrane protein [Palleronia marisminoris]|uniref:DUF599 domain-containing protein n=2 Tax=Palleronia marisminoris TaxID=315423 RepID=A0A1Y5SGG8_9RHOB|nr:Uncharacterized membrane protein [Palleronia marisminoris]SLN39581.1 hypothetical protein PAM7066_01680 [Palleronia marisminoris]
MVRLMSLIDRLLHLSPLDLVAVLLLLVGWQALSFWIEREDAAKPSVTVLMMTERREWMVQMVTRQPRIFDATILSTLRQGTTFFASTVVIAIGGVLAVIGNAEQIGGVAEELGAHATPVIYQVKLGFVALLLTESFLKFVWSNRLFGYCAVVMAAVPNDPDDPEALPRAARAAELNIRAAGNFNRGLRGLYVALAALAWLMGAVALILASLAVFWVIWSREYQSQPHAILSRPPGGAAKG